MPKPYRPPSCVVPSKISRLSSKNAPAYGFCPSPVWPAKLYALKIAFVSTESGRDARSREEAEPVFIGFNGVVAGDRAVRAAHPENASARATNSVERFTARENSTAESPLRRQPQTKTFRLYRETFLDSATISDQP